MSNFHFKSYSELTTNNNNNNNHDKPLVSNDRLSSLRNDSVVVAESAPNYVILTHSDSQKSLDRLFNPPTSDTSVPLRQRNLPPSFFNPIGATPSTKTNNNNNNNGKGQATGFGFHSRSISLDQRPMGVSRGLHFRTPSVLTPSNELESPISGSGSALMSNSIGSLDQTASLNNISDSFQSCHSLQNSANNQNNHHASNDNLQQSQSQSQAQHPQQQQMNSLKPPPPAPAQIIHENETKRTFMTGITHSHHYRNYSSPAYMHQNLDQSHTSQGQVQMRQNQHHHQQQQPIQSVTSVQLTSNGQMQPPSSALNATSFQSAEMPSFMDTEDVVTSTTNNSNDFCHTNLNSHHQVHSTSNSALHQPTVVHQGGGQFNEQPPGSTSYQQQPQQPVVFQQPDATGQQQQVNGHYQHHHSGGFLSQAQQADHLVNNQHSNHGHLEQPALSQQHANSLHHQSFSTGHLISADATQNAGNQIHCAVHQQQLLQPPLGQPQTNGHNHNHHQHHHHLHHHQHMLAHNHNHGHHHHHHHSHQLHQHPHQHQRLHHQEQHQHPSQISAGSRLTGGYLVAPSNLQNSSSLQMNGSSQTIVNRGNQLQHQQQTLPIANGHMAPGNQTPSVGVIYSQTPSSF